ncbi:MAG: threonine--tRNA ligase, partial [Fibrobacterota bacterium]
MSELTITLPDGTQKTLPAGTTGFDVATSISPRLADASVAVLVDGVEWDLKRPLPGSCSIRLYTTRDPESLAIVRHSAAHLMAQALTELYPGLKLAIGPVIEN